MRLIRVAPAAVAVLAGALAVADGRMVIDEPFGPTNVDFQLQDRPVGTARAGVAQPAFLAGGPIAALPGGSLIIDADSGELIRANAAGAAEARLQVGPGAAQLVVDPVAKRAYVADRMGDRVVVVALDQGLRRARTIATRTEPYGLALTPDRATLLVTAVADRQLTAYDVATGRERWSLALPPEPRGVAVSPDGRRAVVGFLSTAAAAEVRLTGKPQLAFRALPASMPATSGFTRRTATTGAADADVGRRFVRAAFAVSFVGNQLAVIAHQTSAPKQAAEGAEVRSTYGGGGPNSVAVDHRITFLGEGGPHALPRTAQALIGVHQPRSLTYDGQDDILYVAGYGSDEVMAIAGAATPAVHLLWRRSVARLGPCGPDGMAATDGGELLVYCALSRRIVRLKDAAVARVTEAGTGPELAKSRLSAAARRGREAFRRGRDARLSGFGVLACASCHPEARTDGLSWRIQGRALQTPLLAARVAGTHPYKWNGGDPTLSASLRSTVQRLGGSGITAETAGDLQAYLESLPRPRTARVDRTAAARGKTLFHDRKVGCARCHSGAKLTDRKRHGIATDMDEVDTPSLIAVGASAPYYHDGSAATLRAVLMEKGTIHGMGRTSALQPRQIDDLIAYLRTL